MVARHITFDAEGFLLEGRLYLPEGQDPSVGVVVCHPHPLYGGAMDNNVVYAVCEAAVQGGLAALAFNFRGVGGSQGTHDKGAGEQTDAIAALDFLRRDQPSVQRLVLAGYSFGAGVALNVATRYEGLAALCLVSGGADAEQAAKLPPVPKLVVVGSADQVFASERIQRAVDAMSAPKELVVVPGADHFWVGREGELISRVGTFFAQNLVFHS